MAGCAVGRGKPGAVRVSKHAAGERCHGGRGADQLRALRRRCCHRRALRAARGCGVGGRPAVLGLPDGRRRRRRRLVHRRLRRHPAGQRTRVRVPRVPLHRRAPRGRSAPREEPSRPADGRHRGARGRDRAGRDRGGAGARRLRARGRRARVPLAARAVAGRAVAHRGRGSDARGDRARSSGSPPTAWPPWPTGRARGCGRRTSSSTCRTRSTRGAGRSPASSARTSAAGWARARPARSRRTSRTAGPVAACVLELGDVNHGMRAVIAPLVLGLLGLGALGVALPVGGGLAAGAARPLLPVRRPVRAGPVRRGRRWRPGARPQRVLRRPRPGPSVRSAPVQPVVRPRPAAWPPS